MITTKQKPTIVMQKLKRKEPKHITLEKIIKPQGKRLREEERNKKELPKKTKTKQKTINKIAASTFISIITLNVNGLNAPIKRHRWLNG